MEPGIYRNLPFAAYAAIPALNSSAIRAAVLRDGRLSMAHLRAHLEEPETPPTDPMRLGQLVHACALEPEVALASWVVMPDLTEGICKRDGMPASSPKATAEYKAREAAWRARHLGKEVVSAEDFARVAAILQALRRHPRACEYLRPPGGTEVTLIWCDEETGVLCKRRADVLGCDLKTTADIGDFAAAFWRRGYHISAALELDGCAALCVETTAPRLVVVETVPPWTVHAAPIGAATVELGRQQYREVLRRYAVSERTGVWPGPDEPQVFDAPLWAFPGGGRDA